MRFAFFLSPLNRYTTSVYFAVTDISLPSAIHTVLPQNKIEPKGVDASKLIEL